jgi:hypothetical protein
MVTSGGQPVACFLTHGGFDDVEALKYYVYELPEDSMIYADKAYNDYEIEGLLKEVDHIELRPMRKKNVKKPFPPVSGTRNWVETVDLIIRTTNRQVRVPPDGSGTPLATPPEVSITPRVSPSYDSSCLQ